MQGGLEVGVLPPENQACAAPAEAATQNLGIAGACIHATLKKLRSREPRLLQTGEAEESPEPLGGKKKFVFFFFSPSSVFP